MHRDLLDCGLRFVMLDIDNTLVARDTHEVPRDVGMWLARARDAGIGFCLLSNNWHRSVLELAERLELPIVAKAMKPLPMGYLRASRLLDTPSPPLPAEPLIVYFERLSGCASRFGTSNLP